MDPENATAALSNWIGTRWALNADTVARVILLGATCVLAGDAYLRTRASSYLQADVVYASAVKSDSLAARA